MGTKELSLTGAPDKYGIVTVFNKDGSFNREFKITGDELAALQQGKGFPPGLTQEEWEGYRVIESGKNPDGSAWERREPLVIAAGKSVDVGDIHEQEDGSLFIKFDEEVIDGRIVESVLLLEPGDWTGVPPNITVQAQKIDQAKVREGKAITSIDAGVITHADVIAEVVDGRRI